MVQPRSWAFRAFALPSIVLLGIANVGCPGNNAGSTTSNAGGDGGSGGSTVDGGGGSGGNGGDGGSGGSACTPETEICDMLDNDCDGQVDNVANLPGGCVCNDGAQQACYTGPDGTSGVGACVQGTQDCANGTWGECVGQIVPQAEACNLVDDDCNGAPDDMGMSSCGVGACAVTVEACVSGQTQSCVPNQPTVEVCDGLDNDCDQLTDESDPMLNMTCMTGSSGVCAQGKMACIGSALVCAPDVMATEEVCDGLDNDCDGMVDNNIPGTGGACSSGQLGVCGPGTISCQLSGGTYQIDCFPDVASSPEICDGLDNDCDGNPDDGNPQGGGACDTGQLGLCQAGTLNCVTGALTCTPNAQAAAEVCDGMDNNCDGQADEGNPGGGQACGCGGAGVTACTAGAVVCNGGPITYFSDDFSDNSAGWTLGQNWSIGPTVMSAATGACGGGDPALDHSPSADNGVAGNVLGGNVSQAIGGPYYLTSPIIDTAAAPAVYLEFWRWLHSDYPNFMIDKVEVFNGVTWTSVWQNPSTVVNDLAWTKQSFNITAYKSAQMQVRFSYQIGTTGAYLCSGWNIDDVMITSAACP